MGSLWIEKFAQTAKPVLQNSLKGKLKVAEITQGHGMFSKTFLECCDRNAELMRTDSPLQNLNGFFSFPSQVSYKVVPGSIFAQLYPSGSLDFIYVLQAFNQISLPVYTSDHLIPSLSTSEITQKRVSKITSSDLLHVLILRHKELKVSGELAFDLILSPETLDSPYSWDCLDLAVRLSSKSLSEDQRAHLNIHTCFRSLQSIKQTLASLDSLYSLEDFMQVEVPFPSFDTFLKTGDLDLYIQDLSNFWTRPIWLMAKRLFKQDEGKVTAWVAEVMKNFKEISRDVKPVTVQKLVNIRLRKLKS